MLSTVVSFLNDALCNLLDLLPASPFKSFLVFKDNLQILSFINFFIPFDICLSILQAWLTAVTSIFLYKKGSSILKFFGL